MVRVIGARRACSAWGCGSVKAARSGCSNRLRARDGLDPCVAACVVSRGYSTTSREQLSGAASPMPALLSSTSSSSSLLPGLVSSAHSSSGMAGGGSIARNFASYQKGEREMERDGGTKGRAKRGLSTYLADELREHVTRQGINHIYSKQNRSRILGDEDADSVNVSTLGSSMDFRYDIELHRKPTDRYLDREYGYAVSPDIDPFDLVESEISGLSGSIKELLGTDHPVLSAAAKYFFEVDGGKKVRPTMVMLMSYACNHHMQRINGKAPSDRELACQRRLAEIAEMVHTASLFHDDVIDKADTRRGVPSVNKVFGNKLAILAGDFLLARATVSLARLRSFEAVELMALTIDNLVKGEVLQMKPIVDGVGAFEHYVCKNYYKTGSLMANSCMAASAVADHDPEVQAIAHEYGKRVGLAFQLVDDVLDFEGNIFSLGKPALNDLQQGLATAPVLLAVDEQPHLAQLIARKFNGPGDVDEALAAVQASDGIQRTKDIAHVQAELAIEAVLKLSPSSERDALVNLAYKMVNRKH